MISVITGNKDLVFNTQGKKTTFDKPIRVRLDHNVQCKLNDGTLKEYKKPVPKVEKVEPNVVAKKEIKKVTDK